MAAERHASRKSKEKPVKLPPRAAPQEVLIEYLRPNPWQPRQTIDHGKLKVLAENIRTIGFSGYLEARRDPNNPDHLQLVWGHRRRDAAALAGLKTLPVVIRAYTDRQMAELALLENHTQEELSYYDQGAAFIRMKEEHGYTVRDLVDLFGVSLGYISNRIAIARLPENSPLAWAAKQGQTDITSLLMLRNLEQDITPESVKELLDGAVSGEINAEQLKAVNEAVRRVNENLNLVDEDSGRLRYTITKEQVKQIDEQQREQRKARQAADGQAYRERLKHLGPAVPIDDHLVLGEAASHVAMSEGAKPDHHLAPQTTINQHSSVTDSSSKASSLEEQGWALVLAERLREVRGLIQRQVRANTRQPMPPVLRKEMQQLLKVLLILLQPSRHRLEQWRRQRAHG